MSGARLSQWGATISRTIAASGASGARLIATATQELHESGGRYTLCTAYIGVGQGIAVVLERV